MSGAHEFANRCRHRAPMRDSKTFEHHASAVQPTRGSSTRGTMSQAALRTGITGRSRRPQELSRLAVGDERSELGLDGDEGCGGRARSSRSSVRCLFTYSCFRRTRIGSWPRSRSYNVSATNDVIASGSIPLSSTSSNELVRQLTFKFEQELCRVVAAIGCEEFTPSRFDSALSSLRPHSRGNATVRRGGLLRSYRVQTLPDHALTTCRAFS